MIQNHFFLLQYRNGTGCLDSSSQTVCWSLIIKKVILTLCCTKKWLVTQLIEPQLLDPTPSWWACKPPLALKRKAWMKLPANLESDSTVSKSRICTPSWRCKCSLTPSSSFSPKKTIVPQNNKTRVLFRLTVKSACAPITLQVSSLMTRPNFSLSLSR